MTEEQEDPFVNRHLDMPCCICSKQVYEVEHIATDDSGDVIVMCPECYEKAKKFFERSDSKNG